MRTINEIPEGTMIRLKDGSFVEVRYSPEIGLYYSNYQAQNEFGEEINPDEYLDYSEVSDLEWI